MKKFKLRVLGFLGALAVSISCMTPVTVNAAATPVSKTYASELTGEQISITLKNQRPIAVMIDNEKTALKHYGVADADIVYEMVNSMANNRITRLMCVYKDWKSLGQTGSIRSVRPTNILLAQEYQAVIIHDGGPFYINPYFSRYGYHLSGGFTRIKNGKPREFTEYIKNGAEVTSRIKRAKFSESYTKGFDPTHFQFVPEGTKADLTSYGTPKAAVGTIDLSADFAHNKSKLVYNVKTGKYDYYDYGKLHVDAVTNKAAEFENVILQDVTYHQYDKNGYLIYNCIGTGVGWYITEGKAVPISWVKGSESGRTVYIGANGAEIQINRGKTYIGLVQNDQWDKVTID